MTSRELKRLFSTIPDLSQIEREPIVPPKRSEIAAADLRRLQMKLGQLAVLVYLTDEVIE